MGKKQRILVVDDFEPMRKTIEKCLLNIGYTDIETCANGKIAWDLLCNKPFDMIISDLNMPTMNGIELLTKVRSDLNLKSIPFIMVTADCDKTQILTAIERGVSEFIVKPFTPVFLEEKINTAIKVKSPRIFPSLPKLHDISQPSSKPPFDDTPSSTFNSQQLDTSPKKEVVLVVDDTPDNITVVANVLNKQYKVSAATSARKALSIIMSDTPPDLILLDIMMPEMDGYEVCRRVKNAPEVSNIPIIFLSSKGEIADITKGFSLGAVDYITKPIEPEILKSRINAHLTIKRSRQNLSDQIDMLMENARLREDVERMTRHDIKTPLSAIASQVSLLIEDPKFTSEQQTQFELIEDSTNQALTMVNNSLDLYKMETGKYKLTPVPVNVMATIEKVIIDLNELANSSAVTINLKEYIKSMHAQGENFLCYCIFSNLLKNAIEASPKGSEVTIAIEAEDSNVAIRFYNKGVIPLEIRENLFEKYITANKKHGNGIGTYSAKLMTSAQQGKIDFITTNEDATVFTVTLPCHRDK